MLRGKALMIVATTFGAGGFPCQLANGDALWTSSTEEFIVAAVCGLIAYPLCEAGWHEIVAGGDITRGIVGLLFGVPIGLIGLSYHWWKGKIGLIGKAAIYW